MSKSSIDSIVDDLTYDVLTVLQSKAGALRAYDKYIDDADAEGDDELKGLFVEMRRQDEEHILVLKEALARRLDDDLGYDDDEVDEDEDEELDEDEVEEPTSTAEVERASGSESSAAAPSRRGESSARHR